LPLSAMSDKYGPIFEAIIKKHVDAYDSGNADAALEMYDEHAVVVSKKESKSFYGAEQIKQMIESYIKLGKVEFKMTRKAVHDVGGDRFYVDADFETKVVASGLEMKGSFHKLFHKQGDQWRCVYDRYELE
ncbi:hypothetical protein PMAYCL1PPCAC_22191, partial [Pristionchus mayeri]